MFEDSNGDGVFDAGEPGYDAVTVTLDDGATTTTQDTVNGVFDFTGLAPGTYTVSVDAGDLPAGVVNTLGGVSQTFTIVSGEDQNGADFGYFEPSTVGDFVWEDLDGNGLQDDGPTGTAGITVTLTDVAYGGSTSVTQDTAAGGAYDFTGVAPGTYDVSIDSADIPAGSTSTTGGFTITGIVVASGEDIDNADFGYSVPARIGDQLFVDNNNNAIFDAGDVGIADVDVTLTGPGQPVGGTTVTTDVAGLYIFTDLLPGTFTVTVDTGDIDFDAAWTSSTGGDTQTLTIVSTDDITTVDFGYNAPGNIGDMIFDDLDGDGVLDSGEPGIDNVTVTLTGGVLVTPLTTVTVNGAYSFANVDPGSYTVTTGIAGMTSTTGGDSTPLVISSGETDDTIDFGYISPAALGDRIWDDLNGDGVADAGEPGLNGITVTVTGPGLPVAGIEVDTAGDGDYSLTGLIPGTYTVTVDVADLPTTAYSATTGGDVQTVVLSSGETDNTIDFGYAATASIGDFVFEDLNGNGSFDAGEPGFNGITVTIYDGFATSTQDTVNGVYDFTGLAPGTYTIAVDISDLPAGVVNTLGGTSRSVTVVSADDIDTADFGYFLPGSIGDLVYIDANGNGTFNVGETGVDNVEVTLSGASLGSPIVTTTVDGAYSFPNLAPGTYTVALTNGIPAGATSTTGGNDQIQTIQSNEDVDDVDFGLAQNVTVGDRVWHDLNNDGTQDAGELGLAGVTIELRDVSNVVLDTATSIASGFYEFSDVAPGQYTVVVTSTPVAYTASTPESAAITVVSGTGIDTVDFGYATFAAIGDLVWEDLNGDGIFDSGTEPGIDGLTVTLTGASLGSPIAVITSGGGAYGFSNLDPGTYTVTVTPPTGGMATTVGGDARTVTVSSNEDLTTVDFGYAMPASIGDRVWNDLNADGVQDAGEPGLGGVEVLLTGPSGPLSDTTDGLGDYSFTNLAPGEYTMAINNTTVPTGVVSGQQLGSTTSATQTLTIESGDDINTVDFGYATTGTVAGSLFEDDDASGTRELGEPGLPSITVELLDGFGVVVDSVDTLPNGDYVFASVPPGSYTVRPVATTVPAGFSGSTPSTLPVVVESDEAVTGINFGYVRQSTIGDLIWHDLDADGTRDVGEPGLAGIDINLLDAGAVVIDSATTGLAGDYLFNNVAPGAYTVQVDMATLPTGVNSGTTMVATTGVPTSVGVLVVSGDAIATVDFAFHTTASIGDLVWHDLDAAGDQGSGEPGLDAVTVNLVDTSTMAVVATTVTSNGAYSFPAASPGTYEVQIDETTVAAGYSSTTGNNPITLTVTSDEVIDNADFGYAALSGGSIGNEVWDDLNADGIRQGGEPGLNGVVANLFLGGTQIDTRTVTNGAYLFAGLAPGTYEVRIDPTTLPTGYAATTAGANSGNTQSSVILSGDSDTSIDFGYAADGSVGDTVWHDLDGNGLIGAFELGIDGVTVELQDGAGTVIDSDVTSSGGVYSLTAAPGSYNVVVDPTTLPSGANSGTQLNPTTPASLPVVITSNSIRDDVDFGYATTATIGDRVFNDLDGDGLPDAGEPGIGGVTLILTDLSDSSTTTVATAANGDYNFTGLAPGSYTVQVDATSTPSGSVATTTGAPVAVWVSSDEIVDTIDFGYALVGTIAGQIFTDALADGSRVGDSGIAGITIELLSSGAVIDTTTSAADGTYVFNNVPPGDYQVGPVLPSGSIYTIPNEGNDATDSDVIPATGETEVVTLISGGAVANVDAGVYELAVIGDTVFLDLDNDGDQDSGEPGVPGVVVQVRNDDGLIIGSATTAADGRYSVSVVPGTLTVSIAPPPGYQLGAGGDVQVVTVASAQTDNTVDFWVLGAGSISGSTIYDVAGDGTIDPTDGPLGGVTVTATWTGPDGPVDFVTTTNPDGTYGFTSLPPGAFEVSVDVATLPDGIVDQTIDPDGTNDYTTPVVVNGSAVTQLDFAATGTARLGDNVFLDVNENGLLDSSEGGVGGVTVTAAVTTTAGVLTYTTVTDGTGFYEFTQLPAGVYTVSIDSNTIPAGMTQVLGSVTTNLAIGGEDETLDLPIVLSLATPVVNGPGTTPAAPGTPSGGESTPLIPSASTNGSTSTSSTSTSSTGSNTIPLTGSDTGRIQSLALMLLLAGLVLHGVSRRRRREI